MFQQYRPERNDYTLYIVGDENRLPDLQPYTRTAVYVDQITDVASVPPSFDEPRRELQISLPFSSLGLELLVGFEF